MNNTNEKIQLINNKVSNSKPIKIMIVGMGSVGNYLYDYLMQWDYDNIEIHICSRNNEKLISDMNIVKVANVIKYDRTKPVYTYQLDLNNVSNIEYILNKIQPDFIVNTSRVYSGLKYGTISWHNIRAYGLWAPLAIAYIKNIMLAYQNIGSKAIVINTSYSDGVNPWLKSAGYSHPDFGSGNLNHLIPRLKFAVLDIIKQDLSNINKVDITLVTSHFHDVLISKEGITENVEPLLNITYDDQLLNLKHEDLFQKCAISMPTDTKRNMMNASSNFEIITKIINASVNKCKYKFHSPGAFGFIGGYPVIVDFSDNNINNNIYIDETLWSLNDMICANKKSIYLDGIENIIDGTLIWTDELINKVEKSFNYKIPKTVKFENIDNISNIIIDNIIKENMVK